MTNELEKHFFSTFGIEPIYKDACTVEDKYWDNEELANEYGTFDQYMNCKCGNQENCTTECYCAYQREVYPQITDHILLELICIATASEITVEFKRIKNVEHLKEVVLNYCIRRYGYCLHKDNFKQRIRTLFEEGQCI